MKVVSKFSLLTAAIVLLYSVTAHAAAPEAGTVLTFKGDCTVEADGKRSPVKLNDSVPVGATIEVPNGAKLKLRLVDGSVVSVAPGTRMIVQAASSSPEKRDVELTLSSGLLRAVVALAAPNSRFEVDTAVGVAAVRSTDWFVETHPDRMQVGVLKGVVTLESRGTKHSVNIRARRGSRIETGKDPIRPRVWRQSEFDRVIGLTNLE